MGAQRKIRDVSMYIDLHGHSRKYNVFMYGCDDKKRPKPQVRAFPKFFSMHNIGKKYVSFADFNIAFTYPAINIRVDKADITNARLYAICSDTDNNSV